MGGPPGILLSPFLSLHVLDEDHSFIQHVIIANHKYCLQTADCLVCQSARIPVSPLLSEYIVFNRLNWQRANRLTLFSEIPHHLIIIQIISYQASDFIQTGQIVIGQ